MQGIICDETEINGVKYVNILVGDIGNPKVTYCLACDAMKSIVDSESIYYSILECLTKFNIPVENVVLFISDAVIDTTNYNIRMLVYRGTLYLPPL